MKILMLLIFSNLIPVLSSHATGPSYIESEMRPVAINKRGDVLCYTRYTKNEMGAGHPMPIVYGYCVLTQDTIIHYTMKILWWDEDKTGIETYFAEYDLWESIYKGKFKEKYLINSVREQYAFTDAGVESHRIDKIMPVPEFNEKKGIDLRKVRQKALFGAVSKNNYSQQGDKVRVLYDFGNVLVLQNNIVEDKNEYGSVFNYINHLYKDLGYDYNTVTGVVFVKENN
jgi:hypothetical protein